MISKIKKSLFLGVGLISLTTKEIEKKVKNLVKNEGATQKEGKKIVTKMIKDIKKQKKKLEDMAGKEVKKQIKKIEKRAKTEITKLLKKINALEKKK